MKNLVIFYSLEDNTRLIESTIVKAINVDIVKTIPIVQVRPVHFIVIKLMTNLEKKSKIVLNFNDQGATL